MSQSDHYKGRVYSPVQSCTNMGLMTLLSVIESRDEQDSGNCQRLTTAIMLFCTGNLLINTVGIVVF